MSRLRQLLQLGMRNRDPYQRYPGGHEAQKTPHVRRRVRDLAPRVRHSPQDLDDLDLDLDLAPRQTMPAATHQHGWT